jgi:hypothetical protein
VNGAFAFTTFPSVDSSSMVADREESPGLDSRSTLVLFSEWPYAAY